MTEIDLRYFLDEEPEPLAAKAPVPVDNVSLASKLERTSGRALDKIDELLAIALPAPYDPSFGNVARAQSAAANTAINAQLRVDETAMRARQTDVMPRLMETLAREERKLAALDEEQVPRVSGGK